MAGYFTHIQQAHWKKVFKIFPASKAKKLTPGIIYLKADQTMLQEVTHPETLSLEVVKAPQR